MKHITDLTCCRALFAAWVFAYHVNLQSHYAHLLGPAGGFVQRGAMGVDGFFILSGMILAYVHPSLAATMSEARAFWAKRLVRIYPVHFAMILVFAGMLGTAWLLHLQPRDPERFSVGELLSHLALLQGWGVSDRWAWNYPAWTISAEWAGYLLFPVLWPVLRGRGRLSLVAVLATAVVGAAAARLAGAKYGLTLTYDGGLYRFFPEFVAGIAILPTLRRIPARVPGHPVAALGVVLATTAAIYDEELVVLAGLWLLLAGFMLAGQQGRRPLLARVPGMEWLGEVSYSFYMSFALVETLQATVWRYFVADPAAHKLVYVLTMTAMTLGLATLAHRLVEEPAMQAFAAYRRRRTLPVRYATRG